MSTFHNTWGYISSGLSGLVGLWGVVMARRPEPPTAFLWAVGAAVTALLIQIGTGVLVASSGVNPGNQHVFYGVVTAVTFTFAYIYRSQFRKRPTLYYGLLMLFCMGLGVRGIMTFGHSF